MALIETDNTGAGAWFFSPEGEKEIVAAMRFANLVGNNEPVICEFCGYNIKVEPALLSIRVDNPKGRVAIRTGDLCVRCPKCGKRTALPGMMTLEAYPSIGKALSGGEPPRRISPGSSTTAAFRNNPYYRKEAK